MKLRNGVLVFTLIIFVIAALWVLLTADGETLNSGAFWLSFVIALSLNMVAFGYFVVWGFAGKKTAYMRLPISIYVSGGFTIAILLAGIIFMLAEVSQIIWPIIVFGILILLYAAWATFSVIGVGYMESTDNHVAEKRLFIKMLEADVLDCLSKASTDEVRQALQKLAENVRFSDPMSHASLSSIEDTLSSLIAEISADLSADPAADVLAKIARAESMLSSRNNRCLMLK